jgi:hypothetical protein
MRAQTVVLFSTLLVASGCGARTYALIERAAPDLGCPEEQLLVTQIDDQIHEARGCGQRRRYTYACNSERCGWIPTEPIRASDASGTSAPLNAQPTAPAKVDARIETGRSSSGSKQLKLYMEIEASKSLLYVIATPGFDAERAMLMWRVPKVEPEPECTIEMVADGNALALGAETKRFSRSEFSDYQTELPYASLTAIAQSSRVAARLCTTELVLSPTQLEKARELMIRLREAQAWKTPQ